MLIPPPHKNRYKKLLRPIKHPPPYSALRIGQIAINFRNTNGSILQVGGLCAETSTCHVHPICQEVCPVRLFVLSKGKKAKHMSFRFESCLSRDEVASPPRLKGHWNMLALVFATTWAWGRHVNTYLDLCVCTGFVVVLELFSGAV